MKGNTWLAKMVFATPKNPYGQERKNMSGTSFAYVVEQLKWALQEAKNAGDYQGAAHIAMQIASVERGL